MIYILNNIDVYMYSLLIDIIFCITIKKNLNIKIIKLIVTVERSKHLFG